MPSKEPSMPPRSDARGFSEWPSEVKDRTEDASDAVSELRADDAPDRELLACREEEDEEVAGHTGPQAPTKFEAKVGIQGKQAETSKMKWARQHSLPSLRRQANTYLRALVALGAGRERSEGRKLVGA
jgi:hypothetical protein